MHKAKSTTEDQIAQFFKYVGCGKQKEAEATLKSNPQLATAYGDLTDCSVEPTTYAPRNWRNITAFQYAVLSLDYHMWVMIQKYMNTENVSQQIAEIVDKATLRDKEGWIIKAGNSDWPQTGWLSLIEALYSFVDHERYSHSTDEDFRRHWYQQVGGGQLALPAHIINEYYHPCSSFFTCTKWEGIDEDVLPMDGTLNWINREYQKLGKQFAWVRGHNSKAKHGYIQIREWQGWEENDEIWASISILRYSAELDLKACVELLKSRTEQAKKLVEQFILKEPQGEKEMTNMCEFERLLGYKFKNENLLKKALTRKSAVNEKLISSQNYDEKDNKRLEYFGDSILRCVISDLLIELHPSYREGNLSVERDKLVYKYNLCKIAKKLELYKFITLGKGEERLSESDNSIFSDIIKTLIGAIFKDCNKNYPELKRIIAKHFDITISPSLAPILIKKIAQDNFKELEDSLDYKFKDKNLLKQALTHSSTSNEKSKEKHNEVLEYLGDSILRCAVSDLLLEEYTTSNIDKLNSERDDLVSNKNKGMLHITAIRLKLSKFMNLGKGASTNIVDKMLIDAMEALIGAMFIDSDRNYPFIKSFIKEQKEQVLPVPVLESGVTKFSPGYDKHRQRQQKNYCFNGLVGAIVMALAATTISQSFNFEKSAPKPKP